MYPHERSLVKRLANKPFVLLGINSDEDRELLKNILVEQNLNWRNWWDGGSTEGPISTEWQVPHWPTIYVIDPHGVIRHVDDRGADLDIHAVEKTIDRLLEEHAADSKKQ